VRGKSHGVAIKMKRLERLMQSWSHTSPRQLSVPATC
jgi:hypothetical protein